MTEEELRPHLEPAWTRVVAALNLHRWNTEFAFAPAEDPESGRPRAALSVVTNYHGDPRALITIHPEGIRDLAAFRSGLLHEALHLVNDPYERCITVLLRSAGETSTTLIRELFREFDEEAVKHLERALAPLIFPEDHP